MKEFFSYFFGAGTEIEFTNFSFAHFAPIFVAIGIIFTIYFCRKPLQNCKHENIFRYILAFALIVSEMSYYWRLIALPDLLDPNPIDHLPITVCGWAVVFCSFMLVGKSQTLFDISYFWLFSGSIFALITPTVISYTGPTRFRYYQFWAEHTLGYIAIFYMIFVHNMRPNWLSMVKSYVILVVLAVIAYFANQILGPGANYLFMAKPEDTPSILDILPPNFLLRICVMAGAVTMLFFLSYLPWLIKDIRTKKQK